MHPLIFLTLLGPLAALCGIAGQMVHRAQAPSSHERNASKGVAGLKQLIAVGEWRAVLPVLLITGGLLWMMTFGALAFAFVLQQRLTGVLMLAVPVAALARIARDYRRA